MNDRIVKRQPWQGTWDPAWNGGGSCEWCGSADGFPCEDDCPDLLHLVESEAKFDRVKFERERIGKWLDRWSV